MKYTVTGNVVDVVEKRIFPGTIYVENGVITQISNDRGKKYPNFILPGFIDSHIHIESSMLSPSEFARNAVRFGTIATISDPHEIANVCGLEGIKFMLDNGKKTPFKFFFGAPSCVPATSFETSGAKITAEDIEFLFKNFDINYLSEVMNFPGVINDDPEVWAKLNVAKKFQYPIDGHCPGLKGSDLTKYIDSGITTDHECTNIDEAEEKIQKGMKVLIREGSASKNFDELLPLLDKYPHEIMFCSDDLHPFDLINGHINLLVKKALDKGYDLFQILSAVTLNPVLHYKIPVGLLRVGDDADFVIIDDFEHFNIIETYIKGILVSKNGYSLIQKVETEPLNNFNSAPKFHNEFEIRANGRKKVRIIEIIDKSLLTNQIIGEPKIVDDRLIADIENDILKIAVVNRYKDEKPSVGFIKNFGLKKGAVASSIAHDSHNIIAIGTNDEFLTRAINTIIENKGGICYLDENNKIVLPLPIAGLMSNDDISTVSTKYLEIEERIKLSGSNLVSPLMSLSFMSLLVIPSLKIGDKGLFDVNSFSFVDIFVD